MNPVSAGQPWGSDLLIVDEVGIESARCGEFILRATYQPIYSRQGATLEWVAVAGGATPYYQGKPVPDAEMFERQAVPGARHVQRLGQVLQLRNYRNIGIAGIDLIIDLETPEPIDPDDPTNDLHVIAEYLQEAGLEPERLICMLGAPDSDLALRRIGEARHSGLRRGIGDFGAGHWTEEQMSALSPDVVRVDDAWFAEICRNDATIRLLGTAVARLHERPARVLVGGIDRREKLHVALQVGADLLQGPLLAESALVGSEMNEEPLRIVDLLGHAPASAPLFG